MRSWKAALGQLGDPLRLRGLKVLGVASILAPTLLLLAYAVISYVGSFRAAEARALHLSSILQDHAQRLFESVDLALRNADQRLGGLSDESIRSDIRLWQDIRRIQGAAPQIGSIFVQAADGALLLTTREYPPSTIDFSDRDYFIAHKDVDAGFFIGKSYIGKISKAPIFNFSIRKTSDHRFVGVVGSSAYVEYFQRFYASAGDAADQFTVLLLRSDGEVLARFPNFEVDDNFEMSLLKKNENEAREVAYAISPLDRKARLYATARVGPYPAYVSYSIARSAVLSQWVRNLALPAALTAIISAVLSALTLFALKKARTEGQALQHLKETAESLQIEIERRHTAEASLQQSQKLEAVGQLTGGIAHDFNNLLMIISGNLALAQKRNKTPQITRMLDASQYAVERGAALTRQLLAFSRGQSLRPEVINLVEVLDKAGAWIDRAMTESVEISFEHEGDVWLIKVDVPQLEAALLNLVVNARDAMAGHGKITISARNIVMDENDCQHLSLIPGEYVALSAADTGCGMSPETMKKVFEPFFTTKERGKGTGLGLSQVHGFAKQSGGDISISSELRQGTTITLYFPRTHEALFPRLTSTQAEVAVRESKVVLLVEDDDEVRKVEMTMLQELGYVVVAARSVSEAIAVLSADEPIDLMLTDVVMRRGGDGIELGRQAQKLRPGISVFVATASLEVVSPFPFIKKPFSAEALSEMLER